MPIALRLQVKTNITLVSVMVCDIVSVLVEAGGGLIGHALGRARVRGE